ncbi:hypothetical protein KUTeg_009359 [Tegillarca granosa]|uniref:Anaphase promoting complex subunit 7 n=1 Tax=Tegillarca granosa TaxID=220873 RepID=A0ABQ9F5X7_TEGGR|nr:hypothetical protein KUTeg_009359 [Tegillarca granosa]
MNLFDNIKQLHDSELFQDLKQLACIVLTLCDNNLDTEVLTLPQKYQCMVFYGNALYQLTEYMKAEDSLTSDVDVKYKIYLCLSQMKQYRESMSVFYFLVYGVDVLFFYRECPFALEAMQGLLGLGVKGVDVAALVMNGLPHGISCEWLSMWIKGNALLQSREYTTALSTFALMDSKTYLKDNIQLISAIAEARFYDGQYSAALSGFQRVNKRRNNANSLDPFNIEAYLLKGTSLLDLKQTQDSALHIQEAMRLAPHRFEAYLGMINCYMASKRTRDALTCAGKAIKTLGSSSRTLTLYASVLSKQQNMAMKAKPYLEKAMKMDPNFLEPVYIMAEILAKEHQYVKGIELLRKQLQTHSTCRLHQMLADFLTNTNEHQEALDQYSIALSLDPSNSRAKEGMERVEKHNDVGLENGYDVDVEDMDNSDNENDYEFSDVESTWSETEFS